MDEVLEILDDVLVRGLLWVEIKGESKGNVLICLINNDITFMSEVEIHNGLETVGECLDIGIRGGLL